MKLSLIRYRTHPAHTAENATLIKAVFRDLRSASFDDLRYASLQLSDGTHYHLVAQPPGQPSRLVTLPAFQAFQHGVRERCVEPPTNHEVTLLGAWRMLGE